MNKKKTIIILLCIVIAIIILAIIVFPHIRLAFKYNRATNYFDSQNYELAIEDFQDISGYKDAEKKLIEAKSKLSDKYVSSNEYDKALSLSKELMKQNEYKESAEENIYNISEKYYIQGEFTKAKTALELLNAEQSDSKINTLMAKINLLISLQGSWSNSFTQRYIKGFTISDKIGVVGGTFKVEPNNAEIIEDTQANRSDVRITYYIKNGKLIWRTEYLKDGWHVKAGDVHESELSKLDIVSVTPEIGMTREQAVKTTWGEPEKKNTTTTKYGTHEQWVYAGNRYLYFDNGILTSIQQ